MLVFHSTWIPFAAQGGPAAFVAQFQDGVQVFFVLSGFLLYRPFIAAHLSDRAAPRWRRYFWRRAARLFPAYWICIVVTAALGLVNIQGVGEWIANLLLVQIYSQSTMAHTLLTTWTLCVEVAFYAFLPLYAGGIRMLGRRIGALPAEITGVALLFVTGAIYQALFSKQDVYLPWVLLPQFFVVFAVGMGLALVAVLARRREHLGRVVNRVARHAGWGWLVAFGLLAYSAERYGGYGLLPGGVRSRSIQLIGVAVAICLALPALFPSEREGLVRRALSSGVLVWLGVLSYGIYLWHLPLIDLFWRDILDVTAFDANPWTTLMFALAATTAVAAASWYGIERRVLGATRRYHFGWRGGSRPPRDR